MFTIFLPLTVAALGLTSTALFAADAKPTNALAAKPVAAKPPKKEGTKWDTMEHGPFLSGYMDATPKINKAVSLNLGNGATVCFDTEMCKLALGWTGGFVKLPTGRDGLEGMPKPGGSNIVFTTPAGPGWADADGNFSDHRPVFKGKPYGPLPREHAKWKGIHLVGGTLLSYTVGKAQILEMNDFGGGVFQRTFDVIPAGKPLTTIICEAKYGAQIQGSSAIINQGEEAIVVAVLG